MSAEKEILRPIHANYSVSSPEFRQSMSHLLSAPLVGGNDIQTLVNGQEFFPAMLSAIRGAQQSITMEMYIWSNGEISEEFVDALCERARAGVRVHLIADGLGSSKLPFRSIKKLRKSGARFVKYHHPTWWRFINRLNHRTHRKILVVDGKIGFTGGACIHDDWQGNAEAPPFWRDNFYEVEGPVVSQIQGVFMDNWVQSHNQVLHGTNYFPQQKSVGSMVAQCFKSGPTDGAELARMNYLMSIAAAQKSIRIAHAYFMPDDLLLGALLDARRRGVRIEVIVPGKIDASIVKAASRPRWAKLLEAGVEFYEFQPSLYHCKLMIVDDEWVVVGSANFDERSLRINDEVGLNVLDKKFAARQIEIFEADKAKSALLTARDLRRRGTITKMSDHFFALFGSWY
jgi:cardiolipin synthase